MAVSLYKGNIYECIFRMYGQKHYVTFYGVYEGLSQNSNSYYFYYISSKNYIHEWTNNIFTHRIDDKDAKYRFIGNILDYPELLV